MSDRTTFAEAPIIVPFPPRQAPSEIAHHRGSASIPSALRARTNGINVAINGILFKNDDSSADAHSSISIIITG